jgi:hypothetical protein
MKSKFIIPGALLLICGIGAGAVYANLDAVESVLAAANAHETRGAVAPSRGSDPFGCHRHGAVTYHCH